MLSEVLMPKLGETMEEGRIIAWRKREGEAIRRGEVLFEVETDKANLEVEVAVDGYLRRVLVREDECVPVLTLLAYIGDLNDPMPAESNKRSPETPVAACQVPATGVTVEIAPAEEETAAVRASPRARKLAEEKGVNVRQLKGSGPGGRIQEKDVLAFLESQMEVETDKALWE